MKDQKYWPADDIELLRDALQKTVLTLTKISYHFLPEDEDFESAEVDLTNGDCRRAWEALTSARIALDETRDYDENAPTHPPDGRK